MRSVEVNNGVQAGVGLLTKAFQILDLFQPDSPSWTQAELVRATGLNRSTTSRLVRYLSDRGYLVHMARSGRYALGLAAIDLGRRANASFDLREICQPALEHLSRETEETVILTALDEAEGCAVCVDQIEGRRGGLRVFEHIGATFPLHAGAAPKAILAHLPADERERRLAEPLAAVTPKTLVDPQALRADIAATIERGFAVSHEETYEGVVGIGAALTGPDERPVGSIAVAAPLQRIDEARICRYGAMLVKAAQGVSRAFKGQDP